MNRRGFLNSSIGLSMTAIAGCLGGGTSADQVVDVGPDGRYVFEPGTESPLRITPDTTVLFDWQSDTHNVVVEAQPDEAAWAGHEQVEDQGFSFSHSFEVPGRYRYVCEPHQGLGMTGEIIVESNG